MSQDQLESEELNVDPQHLTLMALEVSRDANLRSTPIPAAICCPILSSTQ